MVYNILSLNGGGTSGLITAVILSHLEEETGKKSSELFDLIAGISTGSIIGGCISHGMSGKDVVDMYKEMIPKIFVKPAYAWQIWKPKYNAEVFEDILMQYLDYPLNQTRTKFMAHAVQINGEKIATKFWKSWQDDNIRTWRVVRASAAAPTYFEPACIDGDYYVDGAVCANNPSTCALAEAVKMGQTFDNTYILNLACTSSPGYQDASKIKGLWQWGLRIATIWVNTSDPLVDYQCQEFLGDNFYSVNPNSAKAVDFPDINILIALGDKLWAQHKKNILKNIQHKL